VSRIVGLGGGVGASRLWRAMAAVVDPADLTLVVNTGDDLWMHGLRICPDLDTTLYALSGRQDTERGWGVRGDSFRCMDALSGLGPEVWFHLGDLDLATHLLRTGLLRDGVRLVEVTRRLAVAMGVRAQVLPMTEREAGTWIETADGRLMHYQEFLVRHRAAPEVRRVHHGGPADPAPEVLAAIAEADLIVLAPSNPVASLGPILAMPGMREALRAAAAPVVAVSPVVTGVPITDPAELGRARSRAALLAAIGVRHTATGVAGLLGDLCGRFVIDIADAAEGDAVQCLGPEPVAVPTLVHTGAPPEPLLDAVLTAGPGRVQPPG